ncbi:hypothetical protein [Treponema brennaborense]|uniref:Outer membrane protein beta-barrel domain-containing protein n=1 Tax=Treponema brennaborense (strain DSM 12168 / CIP 105900 / DD5/3) TaxID=906968 RepID=F4LIT6_TREBD|nr:hypothetical protein [Treponema brennaborense]AEE16261.1 hypothetical protein Trebr_0825 [Treponema brennaborense DSM 12168]
MKKVFIILILLSAAVLSAQSPAAEGTAPVTAQPQVTVQSPAAEASSEAVLPDKTPLPLSFFFTAGVNAMQNTAAKTVSAPSPILFSLGFGLQFPAGGWVSFEPRVSFFMQYYLWNSIVANGSALPAEIENRTAWVPSLLLDVPAVFSINVHRHTFFAGAGIAFLIRYGFLAGNVGSDEYGDSAFPNSTQLTAADAVKKINHWFWNDLRFLYPELLFGWNMLLPNGWKAGIEIRGYVPLGNLAAGTVAETGFFDTGIITCAARLTLP